MRSERVRSFAVLCLALGLILSLSFETAAKRKRRRKPQQSAETTTPLKADEESKTDDPPEAEKTPDQTEDTCEPAKVKPGEWVKLYDGTPAFYDTFLAAGWFPNRRPPKQIFRIQEDATLYQCPFHLNGRGRGKKKGASARSFLITKDKSYGDFELVVVVKFGEYGGGTHIYYRADPEDKKPFVKGFEYQLNHPDASPDKSTFQTGALSDILAPQLDPKEVMKKDDWNTIRIRAVGNVIEHYLNEQLMLRFDISTDEFKKVVAASRRGYRVEHGWGQLKAGSIGIGDTGLRGAQIYYKDIRIRKL